MKFTVTKRLSCGLTVPNGKSLTIDDFTFLPDFEGETAARHIQTEVDADTQEEAVNKATKLFKDFLAKLTVLDNSRNVLLDQLSVSLSGSGETSTTSISVKASIAKDGNDAKRDYESKIKGKRLRKTPLRHYRDGINSENPFKQFREFYKVLEFYCGGTSKVKQWIENEIPKVKIKKNNRGCPITIYSWIRIKLSHTKNKNNRKDLKPLLISSPDDVRLVRKHLPKMQELARKKIRQEEGI